MNSPSPAPGTPAAPGPALRSELETLATEAVSVPLAKPFVFHFEAAQVKSNVLSPCFTTLRLNTPLMPYSQPSGPQVSELGSS